MLYKCRVALTIYSTIHTYIRGILKGNSYRYHIAHIEPILGGNIMRIFTVKLTVRLSKNIYIYIWGVYYTLTD